MEKINQERIKEFYNSVANVWGDHDPWHDYSKKIISAYIAKKTFFCNSIVLNAGSAGNTYDIDCKIMYHVDIASDKIKNIENAYVASIEKLPFNDKSFDNIVCVGSVLNYCDAFAAISEMNRVLKNGGNLILEFESSWGFEYLGKESYKKDACIITTEYIESQHTQWLYSPDYIFAILKAHDLSILNSNPFHIIDGIFSKFLNDQISVRLTKMDTVLKKFPFFRKHGNNIILHCSKK